MKRFLLPLFAGFFFTVQAQTGSLTIPAYLQQNFAQQFPGATQVHWEAVNALHMVSFTLNQKQKYAYYNGDHQLLVVADPISAGSLSAGLRKSLQKAYKDFTVQELFRLEGADGVQYSAIIQNNRQKLYLKSSLGSWEVLKAEKR